MSGIGLILILIAVGIFMLGMLLLRAYYDEE